METSAYILLTMGLVGFAMIITLGVLVVLTMRYIFKVTRDEINDRRKW